MEHHIVERRLRAENMAGTSRCTESPTRPLYETLDDNQKIRMRFLASYVRDLRHAVESPQIQFEDEAED
jgi:hypothetical protein